MKLKGFNYIFIFLACSFSVFGQVNSLQALVDKWVSHEYFENATVGVSIYEASSGTYKAGFNRQKSLVPASSLKVLTTFTMYEVLGSSFRYKTILAYTGKIEADGTLMGDLHIIGSGDPSLGSERFLGYSNFKQTLSLILDKIRKKGITCIDGNIVVDESIFDSFPIAPTWQWNDLGNYYAAGGWGMNINENEYNVFFNTKRTLGTKALLSHTEPAIPGLELFNEVTIDSAGSGDNSYIFGGPYVYQKRIIGTLPYSASPFKIKGSIPDPPKFMAYSVFKHLMENGFLADKYKVIFKKEPSAKPFDTILSPPLIDILEQANHRSINQYCEAFIKMIGYQKYGVGSAENGIKYVDDYLKRLGINTKAMKMQDGSGLSARNYVSADILAKFMAVQYQRYGIDHMQKMLPQSGLEGSVRGFLSGTALSKNVWLKSGSMDAIQSYTGILKAKTGKWMTFCIIVNAYDEPYRNIRYRIENLVESIYTNN